MKQIQPSGQPANSINLLLLLEMWAKHLQTKGKKIIPAAVITDPLFVVQVEVTAELIRYWSNVQEKTVFAHELVRLMKKEKKNRKFFRECIVDSDAAISYNDPQGVENPSGQIANLLQEELQLATPVEKDDIFFIMNGQSAIYTIGELVNDNNPHAVIVTTAPFNNFFNIIKNKLHTINLLKEPGYRFSSLALLKCLNELKNESLTVGAFIFSNPNMFGNFVSKNELKKIADVLRTVITKDTLIVLDEGFPFEGAVSLLSVAPDLIDNIVLLRFGADVRSVGVDSLAFLFTKNKSWMSQLAQSLINVYGHTPISLQYGLAAAYKAITQERLDDIAFFYPPQVEYVNELANQYGINMSDINYLPDGAGYCFLNLHELLSHPFSSKVNRALIDNTIITTDEDLCYELLFTENILICPGSYLGIDPKLGIVCIACTAGDENLGILMEKIRNRIILARKHVSLETRKLLTQLRNNLTSFPQNRTISNLIKRIDIFTEDQEDSEDNATDDSTDEKNDVNYAMTLYRTNKNMICLCEESLSTIIQAQNHCASIIASAYKRHIEKNQTLRNKIGHLNECEARKFHFFNTQ